MRQKNLSRTIRFLHWSAMRRLLVLNKFFGTLTIRKFLSLRLTPAQDFCETVRRDSFSTSKLDTVIKPRRLPNSEHIRWVLKTCAYFIRTMFLETTHARRPNGPCKNTI